MVIVGRAREQEQLDACIWSGRPEFVAVYGRRRVGKTYLVREFFKGRFAFYATGVAQSKTRDQLRAFHQSLRDHGDTSRAMPKDWFEAFARLKELLSSDLAFRDPGSGRLVVFLDELPWMDTARSDFRAAFDYFWNTWGSAQSDLLLIACGSATSWMIDNLIEDHGGFYNRVTKQIHLRPFTLAETSAYLEDARLGLSPSQVIEAYMVFGGIPFYLNLLDRRYSLVQNIDLLCFEQAGQLRGEFDRLFQSLFRHSQKHGAIVRALSTATAGLMRTDLASYDDIGDGAPLTQALKELEECGFIRSYQNYRTKTNGRLFQLIDPFTLFHLRFIEGNQAQHWADYNNTPSFYAWRGLAFERICLLHAQQIKRALGIEGVASQEYAWRSRKTVPGVQIDLLIDRADGVINMCEAKFTNEAFAIDKGYAHDLEHKLQTFRTETRTKKALMLTLVCPHGLARNAYFDTVQRVITERDLLV